MSAIDQPLVLVSEAADAKLRDEAARQLRPTPEYLRLEQRHDVRLHDWSRVRPVLHRRSTAGSLRHLAAAASEIRSAPAVLTDGEHLGIPLALATRQSRHPTPHVMIAHRLATPGKAALLTRSGAHRRVARILVHSTNQVDYLQRTLGLSASQLHVVAYAVDTAYWSPDPSVTEEPGSIVSAGREHRDYRTLCKALGGRPAWIADGSVHSPGSVHHQPASWPDTVVRDSVGYGPLRDRYRRAAVVVVPVVATPYPFGVTTALEAMSVGAAVVVSGTDGLGEIVEHGRTGLVVAPGDARAMSAAITELQRDAGLRRQLGTAARARVVAAFDTARFADELHHHLAVAASRGPIGIGGAR